MIKKFLPYAMDYFKKEDVNLTFVDIGSRNGVLELEDVAPYVKAYGFEPNPAEYKKLLTGETHLREALGISPPPYRELAYYPYAIGAINGSREFYVTPGPAASGVLEPNFERLREIVWMGYDMQADNFSADFFEDYEKIMVEERTLNSFVKEHEIPFIDYLKVDVEGYEYQVFQGANEVLSKTGVVKVEVCFIPVRKNQKLFSDVDLLLREFGFDLLRYEIDPQQIGYKERKTPARFVPYGIPDPWGQPLSGDAIYVNRNIEDPQRAFGQAVVLLEKDYVDEALFVLKNKVKCGDTEFMDLLREYKEFKGGMFVREYGYRAVECLISIARNLRILLGK